MNRSEKLDRIVQLNLELATIKDFDMVLEKILTEARRLFNADAGSIYIKEDTDLRFSYSQNETLRSRLGEGKKLPYTTFKMPITNASIAGYVANNGVTLNIPNAYRISPDASYGFNDSFDKMVKYTTVSMLTAPLLNNRKSVIGVIQLINAQSDKGNIVPFKKREEHLVHLFANFAANAIERAQLTRTTIVRMIGMAEMRDPKETGAHVNRVGAYAVEIFETYARKKGLSKEDIDAKKDVLRMAAMLHDVGKVAISDTILKKPGRFSEDEYEVMKQHTYLGARLFAEKRSEFDEVALDIAFSHHERWNGQGYPGHVDVHSGEPLPGFGSNGKAVPKKGDEIPLFARIVSIADVYDALSHRRVYKEAWDEQKVLDVLREEKGRQFDPEVVEAFFECYDVIKSISNKYPDE
jgi:HD-GYP domain-containing protein (c-di-GMP phosphodiesterase class II)